MAKHTSYEDLEESPELPWNQLDQQQLWQRLSQEEKPRVTLSFYAFTPLTELEKLRDALYFKLRSYGVLGRIYLATEGINAQISVPPRGLDAVRRWAEERFPSACLNPALEEGTSFLKLTIKVRPYIVADGCEQPLDLKQRGLYLDAHQWHQAMDERESVVVDVRNIYEHEVGHFVGALRMKTDTFRDQCAEMPQVLAPYKTRKVLLYCTGGIRCEKASSLLLAQGFRQVYQLKGGIIRYKHELGSGAESRFVGKNFVFDERLGERVTPHVLSQCYTCSAPTDQHRNCAWVGCNALFLQCADCTESFDGCCSRECQEKLALSEAEQRELLQSPTLQKPPRYKSKALQHIVKMGSAAGM